MFNKLCCEWFCATKLTGDHHKLGGFLVVHLATQTLTQTVDTKKMRRKMNRKNKVHQQLGQPTTAMNREPRLFDRQIGADHSRSEQIGIDRPIEV